MCVCAFFKEVDAIETEVKVMEKDVAKIKSTFTTKEDISQDCLKVKENFALFLNIWPGMEITKIM